MAGSFTKKPSTSTPAKSRAGATPKSQGSAKRNTSLLSFFQKADGPPKQASPRQPRITQFVTKSERASGGSGASSPYFDGQRSRSQSGNGTGAGAPAAEGLFLDDPRGGRALSARRTEVSARERSKTPENIWGEDEDEDGAGGKEGERYNENGSSMKRRKVEAGVEKDGDGTSTTKTADDPPGTSGGKVKAKAKARSVSGPFIDESDSEEDLEQFPGFDETETNTQVLSEITEITKKQSPKSDDEDDTRPPDVAVPPLVREATSHFADDEYTNFDDLDEDEFKDEEGLLDDGYDCSEQPEDDTTGLDDSRRINGDDVDLSTDGIECPVCQARLGGLSEADVSVHVNDCLDGKPSRIPTAQIVESKTPTPIQLAESNTPPGMRMQLEGKSPTVSERAAIPRPAQKDPYATKQAPTGSAFSKLMAGNAEDTAWAAAAANEVASRGKQAYQRTCPFYKIINGFSICVDAFRYGAVEGCNAYFLSHFHSDHYIGLTGSWRHGPIYCSKPTANLVRQQLKVDARWVVALEFETKIEVPATGGVQVTLIEANHCPGSALFLFEKPMGAAAGNRVQRVLHCGDFRASAAHLQHPLLRPDIVDPITGQSRPQRIDLCYLDTTYLSPKYAFPSQAAVIQACAELCVNLNEGHPNDWPFGNGSNGNGGGMMGKFLSSGKSNTGPSKDLASRPERLLVVIGTYSIGKERICLGIARALRSKIYANAAKQRICACLEDAELSSLLTDQPAEAQVHMQTLFEIRAETLADYLDSLKPHFTRVVGFRPTGWTYRPPKGRELEHPPVSTVLHSTQWQTPYTVRDLTPQRGSTRESACFGVPYSEHSSFRELTMFCCGLRIGRVIPTVNVGSRASRERMKGWIERWEAERRKSGLYRVEGGW